MNIFYSKRKLLIITLNVISAGIMNAQTAYTYVKQNDAVVSADGVASYDLSSQNAVIQFDDNNNAVMTIGSNTVAKLQTGDGGVLTSDFDNQSGEETTGSKTIAVTDAGYGTFYSPFQIQLPSSGSVEVYAPIYKEGKLYLTSSTRVADGSIVPACTGLLLKNAGNIEFTFSNGTPADVTSFLIGTAVDKTVTASSVLTLGKGKTSKKYGFYTYTGTSIPASKAYIDPNSLANAAKSMVFTFEDEEDVTTEISALETERNATTGSPAYNILGQRVNTNAKGIIIINGRKYLNK